MHLAGTKWHPYLPPFGFDMCSICTCIPDSLEIECRRSVTCPPLTCDEEEAYRENPTDCCKRCPNAAVRALSSPDEQGDQRSSFMYNKGPNELLASGGEYTLRRGKDANELIFSCCCCLDCDLVLVSWMRFLTSHAHPSLNSWLRMQVWRQSLC